MARILAICVALLIAVATGPAARAQAVDQPLSDRGQELRAQAIHKELRCLVCQNQAISDSNADLARQLRQIVREQIAAGRSDDAVRAYVVERYGDWVLMKPPFNWATAALWLGPLSLALIVALVGWRFLRRWPAVGAAAPLSEAEERRVAALIDRVN
ncbi:MAG: cytochrome c-type biogenesis protein CcmH [Alphaproteobacteria bacterium]|nr:cytochrome c-type biogenesis protein CcmH [Alphaproteobacteria bacterium]